MHDLNVWCRGTGELPFRLASDAPAEDTVERVRSAATDGWLAFDLEGDPIYLRASEIVAVGDDNG